MTRKEELIQKLGFEYVSFGIDTVVIDGYFTIEQVEAILEIMKTERIK